MLKSSDLREFADHPNREGPRASLEGVRLVVGDVVILTDADGLAREGMPTEIVAHYATDLRSFLYSTGEAASGGFTTIVVTRGGKEVFRKERIEDLFGVVYF